MSLTPCVFIHIPKTAGMAFIDFLQQALKLKGHNASLTKRVAERGWRYLPGDWPSDLISDTKLLSGHFPYMNIRGEVLGARYVTMLRDPIAQVESHYWQVRRVIGETKRKPENNEVSRPLVEFDAAMSFEELITNQQRGRKMYIDNIHVRFLGSRQPLSSVDRWTEQEWLDALERAKHRLLEEFSFFGITEKMQQTQELLCKFAGVPSINPMEKRINARPSYQPRAEIGTELSKEIQSQNKYDCELYQFAVTEFEKRIASEGLSR